MRRTFFLVLFIIGNVILFQSCTDSEGFDRPSITMTINNHTDSKVAISINNIELMPNESKSIMLGGSRIPFSFVPEWGDSVIFIYDDSIGVIHSTLYTNGVSTAFNPSSGNILNVDSWRQTGNNTYEYVIPCINSIN